MKKHFLIPLREIPVNFFLRGGGVILLITALLLAGNCASEFRYSKTVEFTKTAKHPADTLKKKPAKKP